MSLCPCKPKHSKRHQAKGSLTWPVGVCVAGGAGAGVAEGPEHVLPPILVIAPPSGLQDECAFGAIRHNEAIHNVVNLAPIPTPLQRNTVL